MDEKRTEQLGKHYEPDAVEGAIYKMWEERGYFHHEPDDNPRTFTIVIPPPNITGALHMGHALNNVLQDILVRLRRMQGYNTLWVPGTDHASIATQNVVERQIARDGLTRQQMGREKFLERVWQWRNEYGNRILEQLRSLGCSCDWQRTRFTMDDGLSRAVTEAFVSLHKQGLIYRGKYIVNWCPRCQTTLADDEVEHEDTRGKLWYIRYPLATGKGHVTVATTRPETMLGDTAVAVNPKDTRYRKLIGELVVLPETGREIPIIADDWVDADFGTGAVKVTPAHDPNDFQIGLRHNLPRINVMTEDGRMSDEAPEAYQGLDRFKCREKLIDRLDASGLLEKTDDHDLAIAHCYRCKTVIEPYLSDQWFVKVGPLAAKAIAAVEDGRVRFIPKRYEKMYLDWLKNLRDWPISRQLWWGHRIPVWYCAGCGEAIVSAEAPKRCTACSADAFRQDEDVLDTWFSSALWPFSTLGWPEKTADLAYYYPTDVLVTLRDIITLWVSRMVMMGLQCMGDIPFHTVYIHAKILDTLGRTMSKSHPETCIDPVDVIEEFGADAVRFCIVTMATETQDVRLARTRFEMGRNLCNKIWNAARFVLMNLDGAAEAKFEKSEMPLEDRWILSRLGGVRHAVTEHLENYRFSAAATALYDFFWHDLCDWYLEVIKRRLGSPERRPAAQRVLAFVLDNTLRLWHPFICFQTEAIYQRLIQIVPDRSLAGVETVASAESIMNAAWPGPNPDLACPEAEDEMARVRDLVTRARNLRAEHKIQPQEKVAAVLKLSAEAYREHGALLDASADAVCSFAGFSEFRCGPDVAEPENCASTVVPALGGAKLCIERKVDVAKERARLRREVDKLRAFVEGCEARLADEKFLSRAPEKIVNAQREKAQKARQNLATLEAELAELS